MKKNNLGFMLAETLLVTVFVAGVLIYLYLQFSNLNKNYNDSYKYNSVEELYALEDIVDLIQNDEFAINYIYSNTANLHYIDISNCSLFTDSATCRKLLRTANVNEIFVTTNTIPKKYVNDYSAGLNRFINKITPGDAEPYRIVASFKNGNYATLRFKNTKFPDVETQSYGGDIVVTLSPNDGSLSSTTKEISYNSVYGALPTPVRTGYTFGGWYNNIVKASMFEDSHGIATGSGEYIPYNSNYMATPYLIPVKGGVTLYSNMEICGIYSYDSNGHYIRRESSYTTTHPISNNAAFIRVEIRKDLGDFDYYMNNLVINEYQNSDVLEYINNPITQSTINKIYQDHMLYAKWTPKGATYLRNSHVIANYDMKYRNDDVLLDINGNRNGTVNNGTWGYDYLTFNGTNTWVNFGTMNTENQTIQVTFEPTAVGTYQYVIGNWEGGGGGINIKSDGTIMGEYYINGEYHQVSSSTIVENNKKYNVALTYDGYVLKLYVNGSLESATLALGTIGASLDSTPFALGTNPGPSSTSNVNYFTGKIYNAAIHDVALSADQIAIDADTTGLYLEKDTYLISNFNDWTFSQDLADLDINGVITLKASGTAIAVSPTFEVNGGFWYPEFDAFSITAAPSCDGRAGANYTSEYYNASMVATAALEGNTNNGWGTCYSLNAWSTIDWSGYNSKYSSRAVVNPRYGPNIKYVRIKFNAGNTWSGVPIKIRNFKIHGESIPNDFYNIKVMTNGNIGVSTVKYASGNKDVSYFRTSGTVVNGNLIRVTQNGTYTVYLKDNAGNEVVKTIVISDIV